MVIIQLKWIIYIILSAIIILELIFVITQEKNFSGKNDKLKKNNKIYDYMQNKISGCEHGNDKKVILDKNSMAYATLAVWASSILIFLLIFSCVCVLKKCLGSRVIYDSCFNEVETQKRKPITNQLTHPPKRRRIHEEELFKDEHATRKSINIPKMNIENLQNESQVQSTCAASESIEVQSTQEVTVESQHIENKEYDRWEETQL